MDNATYICAKFEFKSKKPIKSKVATCNRLRNKIYYQLCVQKMNKV